MNKIKVIIILVLASLMALLFWVYNKNNQKINNDNNVKYILLGPRIAFEHNNNGWNVYTIDRYRNKVIKDINVYDYQNNYKKYDLIFKETGWNYIEDSDEKIYVGEMFGISDSFNFSLVSSIKEEIVSLEEFNVIKNKLELNDIKYDELLLNQKYVFDFDGDGKNEKLMALSNVFSDNQVNNQTLIIYVDNDNYHLISQYDLTGEGLSVKGQSIIYKILKNNNDYYLITRYSFFSRPQDSIYTLYKLEDNNYKKLISN